jgi:hypothetical protein
MRKNIDIATLLVSGFGGFYIIAMVVAVGLLIDSFKEHDECPIPPCTAHTYKDCPDYQLVLEGVAACRARQAANAARSEATPAPATTTRRTPN